METSIQLKTPDNHIIYGVLNSLSQNQALLIFVHGLTGKLDEHHYFNAVPFFNPKGFDTFRFSFYARKPNSRKLSESSISSHISDLNLIINHFKPQYQKIILIGHSIGAPVILESNLTSISKIIFWDPTTNLKDNKSKSITYNPKLEKYILDWGMEIIIGEQMIEEWKSLDLNKLIEKITIPCKFIFAEKGGKYEIWQPYLKNIKPKHDSIIIKNATHGFVEPDTEKELFEETLSWLI